MYLFELTNSTFNEPKFWRAIFIFNGSKFYLGWSIYFFSLEWLTTYINLKSIFLRYINFFFSGQGGHHLINTAPPLGPLDLGIRLSNISPPRITRNCHLIQWTWNLTFIFPSCMVTRIKSAMQRMMEYICNLLETYTNQCYS